MRTSPPPALRLLLLCLALAGLCAGFCAGCSAPPPADDAGRKARIEELYSMSKKEIGGAPEILPEDLQRRLAENRSAVLLVDVRTPKEQAVSIIRGAIPVEAFLALTPEQRGSKFIVAYCTIGYRSGKFVQEQAAKGVIALNLRAGLLAWTHAHGELVTPEGQPTKRLDVWGKTWNLAPLEYEGVW